MDFFSRQDEARRRSKLLVVYFALAVVSIIVALYFVIIMALGLGGTQPSGGLPFWQPDIFFFVASSVLVLVGLSSMFKILSLRGGGGVVARSLGGMQVEPSTRDADERRVLNVVEEMALASGVPVPEVYILPEEGINAFAAGYSVEDAAIGVTRGCIRGLTRDELQGVVAHEFSHILNGDMRLNIRLLGVIFGILVIAVVGRGLMRSAFFTPRSRNSRDNGGGMAIIVIGLAVVAIGYIGVFFGRLIQAAVSRQREYLADAAAVQFTRNPEGISGALKRIGGSGSGVSNAHSEDTAHMFFASALKNHLGGAFATHPPLEQRIRAIEPGWDGKYLRPAQNRDAPGKTTGRKGGAKPPPLQPQAIVGLAGLAGAEHLAQARHTHEAVQNQLGDAVRSEREARAIIFALLLDQDEAIRGEQLGYLDKECGEDFAGLVRGFQPKVLALGETRRLPLLDLCLPILATLEEPAYHNFMRRLDYMVEMDGKTTVFEFALTQVIHRYLEPRFVKKKKSAVAPALATLGEPFARLLSVVIYAVPVDDQTAEARFTEAMKLAPLLQIVNPQLCKGQEIAFARITEALDALSHAPYAVRKQVLDACACAAASDGELHQHEYEILRAIAAALECPLPPMAVG